MHDYTGGIILDKDCPKNINHGALIVGFGTNQTNYWKLKNSSGPDWGEDGYFRIERGVNTCGIEEAASYPEI